MATSFDLDLIRHEADRIWPQNEAIGSESAYLTLTNLAAFAIPLYDGIKTIAANLAKTNREDELLRGGKAYLATRRVVESVIKYALRGKIKNSELNGLIDALVEYYYDANSIKLE